MAQLGDVHGDPAGGDFVDFRHSGDQAKGEYHCSSCGYGVAISRTLPICPMCSGTSWESAAWSPFARARGARQSAPA